MGYRHQTRRDFLASTGAAAAVTLSAGCLGGNAESSAGTTTSGSGGADSWRAEVKEKAREELDGEKLTFWGRMGTTEALSRALNGQKPLGPDGTVNEDADPLIEDGSPWEPLKGNVEFNRLAPAEQSTKYRREAKTGSVTVDALTGDLGTMIKQDVPFMELEDVPAWKEQIPKRLRDMTSKLAYFHMTTIGMTYNSETVSDPPENLLEVLDDRFAGSITLDITPPSIAPGLLLQKYADSVPPHLEVLDSNMTGSEFLSSLADQDPTLFQSSYKSALKVAKGEADISTFIPAPIIYRIQASGFPLEPIDHPSAYLSTPDGFSIPKDPPHPNAAKLLADYVLSTPEVQLCQPGWATINYTQSNPSQLKELVDADWRQPMPDIQTDNMGALMDKWKAVFDVPSE